MYQQLEVSVTYRLDPNFATEELWNLGCLTLQFSLSDYSFIQPAPSEHLLHVSFFFSSALHGDRP